MEGLVGKGPCPRQWRAPVIDFPVSPAHGVFRGGEGGIGCDVG